MKHGLALGIPLVLLASLMFPGGVTAAGSWQVSTSTGLVKASFISTSVSDARLGLEDNVSFEPFGIPRGREILNALGFGGGYSQEAKWSNGSGPVVSCPEALVDLPLTCRVGDGSGTVLMPDGQRAELRLVAPGATSKATLAVAPDLTSLAYDGAVAAIGLALEVVAPGPLSAGASQVASQALELLPESGGYAAAMQRGDKQAAFNELLALSEKALRIIHDNSSYWGLAAFNLIPGVAEFNLGLACAKAILVLANLDAHLLAGNSVTTVTVGYAGGGGATVTPTPTPTPTPAPVVTPTPAPVVTQSPAIISVSGVAPTATQTIRIDGSGFGQHAPYTGSTSFIELSDLTGGWNAGWHEPGSPYSDTVTLRIASWTDSQIVVGGLAGDYGAVFDSGGYHHDFNLNPGDQIRIRVWNAQTSSGPAVFTVTVSG